MLFGSNVKEVVKHDFSSIGALGVYLISFSVSSFINSIKGSFKQLLWDLGEYA